MTISTVKKRGLDRGLGHLLSDTGLDPLNFLPKQEEKTTQLDIEKIKPGKYQPRRTFTQSTLQELADSIRAQGIIQPIIVRKMESSEYEIIAGERRFRAASLAGLHEVPVIVRDVPDHAVIAMALIENIQREDLNAIEEAHALKRLQDEFQLTQLQIAEAIGKSRVTVAHLLGLLNLHPAVQQYLQESSLDKGHAKALSGLSLGDQAKAAELIIKNALTVRETEKLVKQWSSPKPSLSSQKTLDPDISNLERKLSDQLHVPVNLQHNKKGKGKLIIHYKNLDILEGILSKLDVTT